jgi:hypothetical protein
VVIVGSDAFFDLRRTANSKNTTGKTREKSTMVAMISLDRTRVVDVFREPEIRCGEQVELSRR